MCSTLRSDDRRNPQEDCFPSNGGAPPKVFPETNWVDFGVLGRPRVGTSSSNTVQTQSPGRGDSGPGSRVSWTILVGGT